MAAGNESWLEKLLGKAERACFSAADAMENKKVSRRDFGKGSALGAVGTVAAATGIAGLVGHLTSGEAEAAQTSQVVRNPDGSIQRVVTYNDSGAAIQTDQYVYDLQNGKRLQKVVSYNQKGQAFNVDQYVYNLNDGRLQKVVSYPQGGATATPRDQTRQAFNLEKEYQTALRAYNEGAHEIADRSITSVMDAEKLPTDRTLALYIKNRYAMFVPQVGESTARDYVLGTLRNHLKKRPKNQLLLTLQERVNRGVSPETFSIQGYNIFNKGHESLREKDFCGANDLFQKSVEIDPFNVRAWGMYSNATYHCTDGTKKKKYEASLDILRTGLKYNPKSTALSDSINRIQQKIDLIK